MNQLANILGISTLESVSVEAEDSSILIKGRVLGVSSCPKCTSTCLHKKEKNYRSFRAPPISGKTTEIKVEVQRQRCSLCKYSWWPKVSFAKGKQRVTYSFIQYALELLRFGTIKDVSDHLNVSWDLIKDIHKKHLKDIYKDIDMKEVESIAIDEFSIAKRHKYMTIIVDLKTGRILYAIEGRKKNDIKKSLKELKKKPRALK